MASSFYLIWQKGDKIIRGNDGTDWVDGSLTFPIAFPGKDSDTIPVTLHTSARDTQTFETLIGVKLYLTGSQADISLVQQQWPYMGNAYSPIRPELNGGFEISFNGGRSFQRFSKEVGNEAEPASWVPLAAEAVGANGIDGQLGPFDVAYLLVRYRLPPQISSFRVFNVQLAADFDIV